MTFRQGMVLLLTTVLLFLSAAAYAEEQQANKEAFNMDVGILVGGSVLVPLRDITEATGAELTWNAEEKSITLEREGRSVYMKIGEKQVRVNEENKSLETAPRIEDNLTFVPLRLISEAFGAQVAWDGQEQIATIETEDTILYITGRPYLEWQGQRFVYDGELLNGRPHGQGSAVKGTSIYGDIWYQGQWDNGKPVGLAASSSGNGYQIYFNGDYLAFSVPPIVRNGTLYVPLRPLLEKLNMPFRSTDGILQIQHPNRVVLVGTGGYAVAYGDRSHNWSKKWMEKPSLSEQNTLFVPLEFLTDYLSVKVSRPGGQRIELSAERASGETWISFDDASVRGSVEQLRVDMAAEAWWDKYARSLWTTAELSYPGEQRFTYKQYEKLTVVDYNGLAANLTNGRQTIHFEFPSLQSMTASFYIKDPLSGFNGSENMKNTIRNQQVSSGMTKEQVLLSWDRPTTINNYGGTEQWVYRYGSSFNAQYLYFKNGILESHQNM